MFNCFFYVCEDMTLTKEQTSAIKKLSKLRAGALFMEMGTGKTRTTIELIF